MATLRPFAKYHALGNAYLVLDAARQPDELADRPPSPALIRRLCHPAYGLGGDGLLWGPEPAAGAGFALRIFNPDGSAAAMSGNGLRIFARYLWDRGLVVAERPFTLHTGDQTTTATVQAGGTTVTAVLGPAVFDSPAIPVAGPPRTLLEEPLTVAGETLPISAVSLGNPHCVIRLAAVTPELARQWGPLIETAPLFPQRTNVQFVQILNRTNLRVEIWERGAGYTLASGSSACAAAAVAVRLGWCETAVTVHMAGGAATVRIAPDWTATLTGPVSRIGTGVVELDEAA